MHACNTKLLHFVSQYTHRKIPLGKYVCTYVPTLPGAYRVWSLKCTWYLILGSAWHII